MIVERPFETRVEKIVEKPVYVEVERIVEKPVERVIEHGSEITVARRVMGKSEDVEAKFIGRDARQVEWVERVTGEHPDDDIVGDESTVFKAREAYVVDPNDPRNRRQ